MHIIAGRARGTKLASPEGRQVRPTGQRTREALFNLLAGGRFAPQIEGAQVIDACAGTGALGLEALSRGAKNVAFIEPDREALNCLRWNITRLRAEAESQVIVSKVQQITSWPHQPCDILLIDAPYNKGITEAGISALAKAGALQTGALIVAETHKSEAIDLPDDFEVADRRSYGIAALHLMNWRGSRI